MISNDLSSGSDTEDRERQTADALNDELSTARAEQIYNSLPPISPELKVLLHGDRKTPDLTVAERQMIVDFAQTEALRLIAEEIVPDTLKFPVDVITVANRLGVSVKSVPITEQTPTGHSIAGFIIKDSKHQGATIYVATNKEIAEERVRFTICHELGHYITWRREVPPQKWFDYADSDIRSVEEGDTDPIQFCANTFAHKSLIPDYALAAELQSGPSIHQLSNIFGVSETGVCRRMTYLDITTQTYPEDQSSQTSVDR